MTRPGFVFPDPEECPASIAEAVWEVRNRAEGLFTRRTLRERYGTEGFLMLAVEAVYSANDWTLTRGERKQFREIFRGQ